MTASTQSLACRDCGADVAAGLLACPGCFRLIHRDELTRLAGAAESAEKAGDLSGALASWRKALELLPFGTVQRSAIEKRMQALAAAVDGRGAPPPGVGTASPSGKAGGKTG